MLIVLVLVFVLVLVVVLVLVLVFVLLVTPIAQDVPGIRSLSASNLMVGGCSYYCSKFYFFSRLMCRTAIL